MNCRAAESIELEEAARMLPTTDAWIAQILARLQSIADLRPGMKVLDVGAAQGRALIALRRRGFEAFGVEPSEKARGVARALADQERCDVDIREGIAEVLPFDGEQFDAVIAMSVMEHLQDLERSLTEVYRVLRPGGVFWFNSASAVCPWQEEIRGFPFFGWYPDRLKRKIMRWAKEHRPALVGYTEHPAMHWWTPAKAERLLTEAGFTEIWNRWDLRRVDEHDGWQRSTILVLKRSRALQRICDFLISGCSYAARKPGKT